MYACIPSDLRKYIDVTRLPAACLPPFRLCRKSHGCACQSIGTIVQVSGRLGARPPPLGKAALPKHLRGCSCKQAASVEPSLRLPRRCLAMWLVVEAAFRLVTAWFA